MIRTHLLLVLGVALAVGASGDEGDKREQLEAVKERITELQEELRERHGEKDSLQSELREREMALAGVTRRIGELDRKVRNLESELAELRQRRDELVKEKERQQKHIARELESAYRIGRSEPFKLLLNQEDPQKLARTLRYYRYFADARREKIEGFLATLEELSDVEQRILGNQQALRESRRSLAEQRSELASRQEQRRAALEQLNASLDTDRKRLEALKRERKELEALLARLEEAIQNLAPEDTEPFAERRGELDWPVAGPVAAAFGSRRAGSLQWTGWLIGAESGEPVHAVHPGRVVFSDYLRGHGLVLIIDHGDGYLSLYAHNQVLLQEMGDWVRGGEMLARVGNSGGLEKSALYFEIRHNGKPQDPRVWLGARR